MVLTSHSPHKKEQDPEKSWPEGAISLTISTFPKGQKSWTGQRQGRRLVQVSRNPPLATLVLQPL